MNVWKSLDALHLFRRDCFAPRQYKNDLGVSSLLL
jgi:hypothetical protein